MRKWNKPGETTSAAKLTDCLSYVADAVTKVSSFKLQVLNLVAILTIRLRIGL